MVSDSILKRAGEVFAHQIKDGMRVGIGTSDQALFLIKELRRKMLSEDISFSVVPTSLYIAHLMSDYGLKVEPLGDYLDICVEFADRHDSNLNFVKTRTHSLIRDKMMCLEANNTFIVVPEQHEIVLNGLTAFEVSSFNVATTLNALRGFGAASLRLVDGKPFVTEGSNFIVDVEIGGDFDMEDVENVAKRIPGVLESGIFYHIADKAIVLSDKRVSVETFKTKAFVDIPVLPKRLSQK